MSILNSVNTPEDLRRVPAKDIPALCEEIRSFLIETVPKTGGHLASNLGAVELTVALHRVFNAPADHILFDVGHQSYVHKMLTGRKDRFDTLRTPGGLSGFTTRKEGEYDPFGAGHSSTSVSAALGFAEADKLNGTDAYSVCVVGDGAYTGGMIHEALNNCKEDLPLIIVLNENGMSISPTKGAFSRYLARVRVSRRYLKFKAKTKRFLQSALPEKLGDGIGKMFSHARDRIKKMVYSLNYFEQLGLYYIGPLDGNDESKVENALIHARDLHKCAVVHLRTVKGKGYAPAERNPGKFHSVYPEDKGEKTFHAAFAEALTEAAAKDEDVTVITAAMGAGTGMDNFGRAYPDRFFDVGIAEPHAVTFAAGMAANGKKPFAVIYSTFLQRAYDNVLHDVALQNLPVRLVVDRAGLAVADGATHHGIFDVSFLGAIPNMHVLAPATYPSVKAALSYMLASPGPVALRYENAAPDPRVGTSFVYGDTETLGVRTDFPEQTPPQNLIVTYGAEVGRALDAKEILKKKGVEVGVVLLEKLAPAVEICDRLSSLIYKSSRILFAEEGIRRGGVSASLVETLFLRGAFAPNVKVHVAAVEDFASPASVCDLYEYAGLSPSALASHFLS